MTSGRKAANAERSPMDGTTRGARLGAGKNLEVNALEAGAICCRMRHDMKPKESNKFVNVHLFALENPRPNERHRSCNVAIEGPLQ